MNILGISCFYHDAAAALLKEGRIIAAAQEERFTRFKHDPSFPTNAIDFCLQFANLTPGDLDAVAFYDKPFLKFERILLTALDNWPRGIFSFVPAMRNWLGQKLWIKQLILEALPGFTGSLYFPEHHLSHAASAFLVSPFKQAAILTVDGVGEWATATRGYGEDLDISLTHETRFPHSLGLLYSAFTSYLGFKVNSAEYKVMGLAPYGKPIWAKTIMDEVIDIKSDGSFRLNLKYFAYPYAEVMTAPSFHRLFGGEPRPLGSKPGERETDLAASIQHVLDIVLVRLARDLFRAYRVKNLCMAGGVALNCVSNAKILQETPFRDLFIQPAAGDAGGAVGAAVYIYHTLLRQPRRHPWQHVYLGPEYKDQELNELLQSLGVRFRKLSRTKLITTVAGLIEKQRVVGLFQGRMEFGPRALGNRSILADARNPENKDRVNLKIKFREAFRPFAPSVLEEDAKDWFDLPIPSPYMFLTAQAKKGSNSINTPFNQNGHGTVTINDRRAKSIDEGSQFSQASHHSTPSKRERGINVRVSQGQPMQSNKVTPGTNFRASQDLSPTLPQLEIGRRDKFSQASWTRPQACQKDQIRQDSQASSFEAKKISVATSEKLHPFIPAVVHVDNSARIQTVNKKTNPLYWEIISEFKRRTGVPVVINTSFNQRGEPIVESPKNALNSFLRTDMDDLVIGSFHLKKEDMPQSLIDQARKRTFKPD